MLMLENESGRYRFLQRSKKLTEEMEAAGVIVHSNQSKSRCIEFSYSVSTAYHAQVHLMHCGGEKVFGLRLLATI